jgi:hypothetical protein
MVLNLFADYSNANLAVGQEKASLCLKHLLNTISQGVGEFKSRWCQNIIDRGVQIPSR